MANLYVVHPGTITLLNGTIVTYDAGTLAALYGLSPGEYDTNTSEQNDPTDGDPMHIHLRPRQDGAYRNIKTELGDTGTDYHIDKMANWRKYRERNGGKAP